jgi:hypothetical protein
MQPELKELIETQKKPYVLIDVRNPNEQVHGQIPTARNIPRECALCPWRYLPITRLGVTHSSRAVRGSRHEPYCL